MFYSCCCFVTVEETHLNNKRRYVWYLPIEYSSFHVFGTMNFIIYYEHCDFTTSPWWFKGVFYSCCCYSVVELLWLCLFGYFKSLFCTSIPLWSFFFLHQGVVLYSRDNKELDLLLFWEVCDFVSRVDRVLSRPGGSLLLAGRSGVGRHTATCLVSHMHGYTLFTPKISRVYTLKHFSNDLKSVRRALSA